MGNRLASRTTAVPLCDVAKRTRVAVGKWPWNCNGTGHRLPGIESRIRIAVAGSGIQDSGIYKTKTTRNENLLKEQRSGIGKPVENIALFQHGWFHGLPKNKTNSLWRAPISFDEDYKYERTFDKLPLNAFAAVLSTIGFLFGFATNSGVSAATDKKPEDEDSYYSQESSERLEEFPVKDGITKRDNNFSFVFRPNRRRNRADVLAALETAKQEVEKKANSLKKPPSVIAFLMDEDGNIFAAHSIRGQEAKEKLYGKDNDGKIYKDLRDFLDEIGERGVGHGFCAEVVLTQKLKLIRKYQQKYPEAERMFQGKCIIFAFQRNKETGEYDQPKEACASCEETNKAYDFIDLVRWCSNLCEGCFFMYKLTLEQIYRVIDDIFYQGVSFSDLTDLTKRARILRWFLFLFSFFI